MQQLNYAAYHEVRGTIAKTRQVVMLYDVAVNSMRQAMDAIRAGNIETRFNLVHKAYTIMINLQACLDFDNGGEIAKVLDGYYDSVINRMLRVHRTEELELCEQVIRDLRKMRDAWQEVDRQVAGNADPVPELMAEAVETMGGMEFSA